MIISNTAIRQTVLIPSCLVKTVIASTIAIASISAHANQTLTSMTAVQTSEQTTQLRLDFSDKPTAPQAYQLDNPSRLVLDFPEVANGLPSRYHQINEGVIEDITSLSNDSTTRLIIGLSDSNATEFMTRVEDNSLLVNISKPSAANQTASDAFAATSLSKPSLPDNIVTSAAQPSPYVQTSYQPDVTATTSTTSANLDGQDGMVVKVNPLLNPAYAAGNQSYDFVGLENVAYTEATDGGGEIKIDLVNESIPVDIQRQGNKIIIRMTGAKVPSNLVRQHSVTGGLVSSVNARNVGKNGVVTIAMAEDFEYQAFQSGNQVSITIQPPEQLRQPTIEEKQYSGDPISVDFQDVEVRSVLHLLSQFTDMNIVASDNVSGSITLNLINVPWDQALDLILKSKKLGMRTNGNVILVAPATELAEQEADELQALQKVDDFQPLRTEYIRLNYANAADLMTLISQGRNSGGSSNDNDSGTLLSKRGTVTVDNRTNTLIIKDNSDSIDNIRALIDKIDIPVRQVMIEARIVSASDNFSKEMGVKWGILSNGAATNRNLLVGGSDKTLADLKDFTVESTTINGQQQSYPTYSISRPDNLNVDLGVTNAAGRIAFGLLSMSDLMIDLELSAMQADGRGEVISSPKVLTMDKQTAKVSSGTQVAYPTESESGGTTVEFIEALLSLEVTPNITPDGKIGLQLDIENGRPNFATGSVPSIEVDTLNTNVLVEDGQTVVLGGVFRNSINNSVNKVPFLGDLPYVGRLFQNKFENNAKQELLIFVTPKLINEGVRRVN